MNPAVPRSAGLVGAPDGDPGITRLLGPLVIAAPARPPTEGRESEFGRRCPGEPATTVANLFDEVISQIYRAGLLIHTCSEGAGPALVEQLGRATDELDAAIRRLQWAADPGQLHRRPGVGAPGDAGR